MNEKFKMKLLSVESKEILSNDLRRPNVVYIYFGMAKVTNGLNVKKVTILVKKQRSKNGS